MQTKLQSWTAKCVTVLPQTNFRCMNQNIVSHVGRKTMNNDDFQTEPFRSYPFRFYRLSKLNEDTQIDNYPNERKEKK